MHKNSLDAYAKLPDLNPRHKEVLSALQKLGKATDRQIQQFLGYTERGQVQPRITDLFQRGMIEEAGDVECPETGSIVRTTRIKRAYHERDRFADYSVLLRNWSSCNRCALSSSRRNVVMGKGNLRAPVFIVGQAPGEPEDISGIPFVGSAGRQLDRLLHKHGFSYGKKGNVFIANISGCRATDGMTESNRPLRKAESDACFPRLSELLECVYPSIVILLGKEVSDIFFVQGGRLRFPFSYKGVHFYRTRDMDLYNVDDFNERMQHEKEGAVEWRYISEGYAKLLLGEADSPTITWNLPQLVKIQ